MYDVLCKYQCQGLAYYHDTIMPVNMNGQHLLRKKIPIGVDSMLYTSTYPHRILFRTFSLGGEGEARLNRAPYTRTQLANSYCIPAVSMTPPKRSPNSVSDNISSDSSYISSGSGAEIKSITTSMAADKINVINSKDCTITFNTRVKGSLRLRTTSTHGLHVYPLYWQSRMIGDMGP